MLFKFEFFQLILQEIFWDTAKIGRMPMLSHCLILVCLKWSLMSKKSCICSPIYLPIINKMIRLLTISRSGSLFVSMNDLFLSVSTGIFLILHYKYYVPLMMSQDNNFSLYSLLYSLLFITTAKTIFDAILAYFSKKKERKESHISREIPVRKLIYAAAIKTSAYLCMMFLVLTINSITFALAVFLTLVFIFSLQYGSRDNRIVKILWKGRSLGTNKIKTIIICALVLGAILLQPLTLTFLFQLHFEVFIILTSSLMLFAYYYLHKLMVTVTPKDALPKLLCQVSSLQCLYLTLLIVYYAFMEENDLTFDDQLTYISQNALIMIGILIINFIYELVLIETLKKASLNRLIITQVTGLLWFNIYQMSQSDIELQHYISVIVMLFILLVNIGLFSQQNIKKLLDIFSNGKKKKKKTSFTEMQMKQSQNDH